MITIRPPATYAGRKIREALIDGDVFGPRLLIEQYLPYGDEYSVIDQYYKCIGGSTYPTQVRDVLLSRVSLKAAKAFAIAELERRQEKRDA